MADPITWGLLNLIKKRVKGVQTTLDGVSDQVSGLPDSLNTDFTEVKEAVAGVKTDVEGIKTDVSGVKVDTESILYRIDELKNTADAILNFASETNIVVKDILQGRQISDWVEDLKTHGTNSDTYKNSERMNALIADRDSCMNPDVESYILKWGIANNKIGIYLNSVIGNVSGVTWSSLTTPNSVFSNSKAVDAVFGSSIAFNNIINTGGCGKAIIDNYSITESRITSNPTSWSIINNRKKSENILNAGIYTEVTRDNIAYYAFHYYVGAAQSASSSVSITVINGNSINKSVGSSGRAEGDINKFISEIYASTSTGTIKLDYTDLG